MEKCAVCNEYAPFKCTGCKEVHYCNVDHQKKDWKRHKINCRPFKIERSDELGRYLIATRDIPAKSVIFIESPLVIGPKWCVEKGSDYFPCVGCFKPTPINGNKCPNCLWPVCQPDCVGLKDPQMHGVECFILCLRRDVNQNFEYRSDVLLTLRCLLMQWKYPDRWEKVMMLESHDEQRIGTRYYKEADERIVSYLVDNFWSEIDNVEKELGKKIVEKRDRNILHTICGIMEVNALNIALGHDNNEEVSALFEWGCLLEHSCLPNCFYTFDTKKNFKITMRAGRTIKKGEHLSIMYTHMLWGTHMRNEHLQTNKYFICKCERCVDSTELGTNFSAMKCIGDIGKTCGGVLLPKDPIDLTSEWFCDRCDVSIPNEQIEIILTNIEQEVDDLMMPSVSRKNQELIGPQDFEALIEKLSHLLDENHFHMFALKHSLIQMYGHKPKYLLHELSDDVLQKKIKMCEQLLNILDHIDPNTMRLTLYTGIVLYELHLAILEQNRRHVFIGNESNKSCLLLAQKYLCRGKEALSLNQDIIQGRQLYESFQRAENSLQMMLNA